MKHYVYALHSFNDSILSEQKPFTTADYSRLKFGCDATARRFGYDVANGLFERHSDLLIANADRIVIIPSPYNFVMNAASIMTRYLIAQLNRRLVAACGAHVDTSLIHRKVSYINDYGFLSAAQRKGLISNDHFYVNQDFLKGKLLICVDDVVITGTHEDKLREVFEENNMRNDVIFAYYAKYNGGTPSIESKLNYGFISTTDVGPLVELVNNQWPSYNIIVRPLKYLLSSSPEQLKVFADSVPTEVIRDMHSAMLAEGYYKIPSYQQNLSIIANRIK